MNIRTAFVSLALVLASAPAFAQGNHGANAGNGGGNGTKDLSDQLAQLTARVAKLEGNITAADLAGTYNFVVIDVPLAAAVASPPRPARIETDATSGTLVLNADGTGSIAGVNCGGVRLIQGSWTLEDQGTTCDAQANITWSYENGTLTTTEGNEQLPFTVAAGGRVWTLAGASFHAQDHSSDMLLFIVTRLQ
jgi:hypothetical protein